MALSIVRSGLLALSAAFMLFGSLTPASADGYPYYHHRHYRSSGGYGAGPFIVGTIAGLAVGSMIYNQRRVYEDDDCYYVRKKFYDDEGNYIGRRRVLVCE